MVTTTETREHAEFYLKTAETIVEDLVEIAGEWEKVSKDEQLAFSYDWGNVMVRVGLLGEYADKKVLDGEHYKRYLRLREHLVDLLPLIRKLHLRQPAIPLD